MNSIHLLQTVLSTYWGWFALLLLLAFLKSPFMKGVLGELIVNIAARLFLNKQRYHLFKNVTLPTEDGTTQIDHVIVSRYGLFVIETKNMKGWIFGSPRQKTWTQKIYRHSNKFQNPLHQNYKHTQTLQAALELDEDKLFSLIVFVGDSTFKTAMPDNVVYAGGYIRFIKSKIQPLLTDTEVQSICNKIAAGRLKPSIKTHRAHVQHVKTIVAEKQPPKAAGPSQQTIDTSCPQCGKLMVLRTANRGANQGQQFWGCSGFPKCRVVRPVQ